MASFIIEGNRRLKGEITPQGAKNEALQVICATLLTSEEVRLQNVPDIVDVNNLIQLLCDIGVKVTRHGHGDISFQADALNLDYLRSEEYLDRCAALRGSVLTIGPLVARFGRATISKPGGDKIGRRRLDTHFYGLKQLGAEFHFDAEKGIFELAARRLQGAYMLLDEASVTGTANIIMAAVLAEGTTTIYNAACEPYIQQLCHLLNRMGANISGIASNLITIVGVTELHGATHRILPDMIEIGSFIDGSFMTLADAPWPGLTPDLLSILLVVATQAKGSVLFHQKMFESRLFFVDKLIDMGAQIILCDPHRAVVVGHNFDIALKPHRMVSPDIRAGIAMLIAAMCADGTSRIDNVGQIDRGYERIEERLNALGASIKRV